MKIKYTNENLRKQVKGNMMLFRFFMVSIVVSLWLIVSSPLITYIQTEKKYPIPFDKLKPSFSSFKIFYAELYELPEQLGETDYYEAEVDGHRFAFKMSRGLYRSVEREFEENGSAWVHGTINTIKDDENTEFAFLGIRTVFMKNSGKYLDCFSGSLYYEMTQAHPIGMVFGITWLIVVAVGMNAMGTLNVFKHFHPACGDTKYSVKEIDDQANMPDSVWLPTAGIYLAPKIMIGTQKGMTAVNYSEIKSVSIKASLHFERYKNRRRDKTHDQYFEFETFQIIVRTKGGRRLKFSDTKSLPNMKIIYDKIREHSPDAEIIE